MPGYRWGCNPPPDWMAHEGPLLMRWRRDIIVPEIRNALGYDTSPDGRMYEWLRDILANRGKSAQEIDTMLREVEERAAKEIKPKPDDDDDWKSLLIAEKIAGLWADKLWDDAPTPEKIAVFEATTRTWEYVLAALAGDCWHKNKKRPATQEEGDASPQPAQRSWYDFYRLPYSKLTAKEIDRLISKEGPTHEEELAFEKQQREREKNKGTYEEAVQELIDLF